MHTYNIIKKHGKGNIQGSVYTIEYQVDKLPNRYMVDMYCLGSKNRIGQFAWLEGTEIPFVITKQDRTNFLQQLALYQKGSSYRKNNPIVFSDVEILQSKRNELYEELRKLDNVITDKINEQISDKVANYKKAASKECTKSQINELLAILNNDSYMLCPLNDVFIDYRRYDGIYVRSKVSGKIIAFFIEQKGKYILADMPDKVLSKLI